MSGDRGWFGALLGFLAKPWVFIPIFMLVLVLTGVLTKDEARDLFGNTVNAVKDWNPLGGVP